MTDEKILHLFSTNEDFHAYVLRFANSNDLTIEEALNHSMVKEVGFAKMKKE